MEGQGKDPRPCAALTGIVFDAAKSGWLEDGHDG